MKARIAAVLLITAGVSLAAAPSEYPKIPREYLEQVTDVPAYWLTSLDEVFHFLDTRVKKGSLSTIGTSAGLRPMRAVLYGQPRQGKGTTTFSGSLGFQDVRAWFGPDYEKKVYMAFAAIHGGEFEAIAGMVNLISVLETGRDLRGKEWPGITAAAAKLDRIILMPVANPDGRARVPVRMLRHWGSDYTVPEYFNTGAWPDGKIIGWPQVKQNIPLDFAKTQFPGGYPNDNGVNLQHDDFFRYPQPETRALFDLAARERPDVILNLHTGATYVQVLREWIEPALTATWMEYYKRVNTALTDAGLRGTKDVAKETDPSALRPGTFNLTTALNLNSGALAILIESPSHAASHATRDGKMLLQTPDELVDAQLICHEQSMRFLVDTGGRYRWALK